ncbi:MAG: hypothetical protein JNM07_10775 [Phycisphaerae bacterium]|nr:hypothetical protein [Phycisphaerae bacterium]
MIVSRRMFGTFAITVLLMIVVAPHTTLGQVDDKTRASLSNARETYEREMNEIRAGVARSLTSALENAAKAKDPSEATKKAREDLHAFENRRQLPECKERTKWEQAYEKAAKKLKRKYAEAESAYSAQKQHDLADAVRAEAGAFDSHWDLVPWQDKLGKAGKSEIGADPFVVGIGEHSEYRIEVTAKRKSDAGSLMLELPLANDSRVAVPALIGDKGDIRMLLTVREGAVSADLGAPRPIDMKSKTSGDDSRITLRGKDGTFAVESVRVKPIVNGAPPSGVQDPARTPRHNGTEGPRDDPAAHLIQASKWSGRRTISGNNQAQESTVTVTRRDGDTVVLRAPSWEGTGTLFLTLRLNGSSVSVDGIRYEGSLGRSFTGVTGSGTVSGDSLKFSCSFLFSYGAIQGQRGSTSFDLKRQ